MKKTPCPCASGLALAQCCAPLISGAQQADSALALMRSRYTAFAQENPAYLLGSWDVSTRPEQLDLTADARPQWIGLRIVRHEIQDATHATVEFIARYRINGRAHRLHETSRFICRGGCWYYLDGDIHT